MAFGSVPWMSLSLANLESQSQAIASLARDWADSPHQPALSEHTLMRIFEGSGRSLLGDSAMVTLVPAQTPGFGLVEVAGAPGMSQVAIWHRACPKIESLARDDGMSTLELIAADEALLRHLAESGHVLSRQIERRRLTGAKGRPGTGHIRVPDLADPEAAAELATLISDIFEDRPEYGSWSAADVTLRIGQPWFDPGGLFVAGPVGAVTGLCWTKVHPDGVGEIYVIGVTPGHRRHGVATELLLHGLDHLAKARGCEEVIAYSNDSNTAARDLYERHGFVVDRVDHVFELSIS